MGEHEDIDPSALGPNMWLIDEFYRRYREDPSSVSEAWREFFEDFKPKLGEPLGGTVPGSEAAPQLREASPHPTPRSATPPPRQRPVPVAEAPAATAAPPATRMESAPPTTSGPAATVAP